MGSFQSEEGNRRTISFNSRMWHATRPWSGDRLVLAVYNVRGLEKITKLNEEIVEALGFQLPQELVSSQVPRICKLLGNEGGETQEPQQMEVELEPVETFMHIRMTEEEWISTSARYGADHYIADMAARWRYINPQDGDLNSVIPAAIVADLGRDWVQHPRIFLVNDDGEELRVGRMMAMTTTRAPSFDPEGMTANWIKACKVYNEVLNIEEMVVLWIHRRVVARPVEPDGPREDGGEPPVPDLGFRGGIPRLAVISVQEQDDPLCFVEVCEEEFADEGEARIGKAALENLYTTNIEKILDAVDEGNPLKVTHTVDPREVLPVVDKWVSAMQAELTALEQMPAIKRYKGAEAKALTQDPNIVIVPSKLVFTVKPGATPGTYRRKVRGLPVATSLGSQRRSSVMCIRLELRLIW